MSKASLLLAVALGGAISCAAADKSAYSLFRRTPADQLRELNTDRPDATESPYTVDAGWWQVEADFFNFTRDHDTAGGADVKTDALALGTVNLKVGLTSRIDLQTVVAPYTRVRTNDRVAGASDRISGFGDITSRLKINFWGNDGGDSAFGLMPFVKWPTNRHGLGNKSVEGGLILPYAHTLPGGWDLGTMTEFDVGRDAADTHYRLDWLNTVTVGHDLTEHLGFYAELTHLTTRGPAHATFDFGLTYGLGRNVQLDAGFNVGLTRATDDLSVFSGISTRF